MGFLSQPRAQRLNADLLAAVLAKVGADPSLGPAQAFDAVVADEGERFLSARPQRALIAQAVYESKRCKGKVQGCISSTY